MADTLKTPFGTVSKKTALIGGGIVAAVFVYVVYRGRQAQSETQIPEGEINPATGYPFGSAEDAAALAQQSGYAYPPSYGGGGGGGSDDDDPPIGEGFTNNAQWAQAAVLYMTQQQIVTDPAQLAEALGKYIAGSPVTTTQKTLIEQAIAFQGKPPLSGANGYPPSINTAPAPPPTTTLPAAPTGLKASTTYKYQIIVTWTKVPGATRYEIYRLGLSGQAKGLGSELTTSYDESINSNPLFAGCQYEFSVRAVNAAGAGPWAKVRGSTRS